MRLLISVALAAATLVSHAHAEILTVTATGHISFANSTVGGQSADLPGYVGESYTAQFVINTLLGDPTYTGIGGSAPKSPMISATVDIGGNFFSFIPAFSTAENAGNGGGVPLFGRGPGIPL